MSLLSAFLISGEGFDFVIRSHCEQLAVDQFARCEQNVETLMDLGSLSTMINSKFN
jgi:hypothetical protein